jgi:hypothetical protein
MRPRGAFSSAKIARPKSGTAHDREQRRSSAPFLFVLASNARRGDEPRGVPLLSRFRHGAILTPVVASVRDNRTHYMRRAPNLEPPGFGFDHLRQFPFVPAIVAGASSSR